MSFAAGGAFFHAPLRPSPVVQERMSRADALRSPIGVFQSLFVVRRSALGFIYTDFSIEDLMIGHFFRQILERLPKILQFFAIFANLLTQVLPGARAEDPPELRARVPAARGARRRRALELPRAALARGLYRLRRPGPELLASKFLQICNFLAGSFSAVSNRKFARKYAFDSVFQALQDLHTFAPLQSQFFRKKSV